MQEILPAPWNFVQAVSFFLPKIMYALVCGGLIGIERQLKHKAAGMKTNMLICLGSTVYTGISILIWTSFQVKGVIGDPARVAAQIVSGIGFLGGGAIIQSRGNVVGLTTAANIWVVAALGICIGMGEGPLALGIAALIVVVLMATSYFETHILGRKREFACTVHVDTSAGDVRRVIGELIEKNDLDLEDLQLKTDGGKTILSLRYTGLATDQKQFMLDLWSTQGVIEIRLG